MKKTILFLFLLTVMLTFSSCHSREESTTDALFAVVVDGKYGYIDQKGIIVIEPQFDWADDFYEGFAQVCVNDLYGFIDKSGKMVVEPQYGMARNFSEGLAAVQVKDSSNAGVSRWGFIDTTGKMVIAPQFYDVSDFSEGLAQVRMGDKNPGKCGYIDKKGAIVISPLYDMAEDFVEGLAYVTIDESNRFIDPTGKTVFELYYKEYDINADEVGEKNGFNAGANNYSEGLSAVWVNTDNIDGEWGFVDKTGKFVIEPQFFDAGDFSEGLARITNDGCVDGMSGYIDKTGKTKIEQKYYGAEDFSEGLAAVENKDNKWGYIDPNGKMVIKPQFDQAGCFSNGLALVMIGEKYAYIDKKGTIVFEFSDVLDRESRY